jgi:Dolichyl-phosphate-mannose-protein mannosyltransferase
MLLQNGFGQRESNGASEGKRPPSPRADAGQGREGGPVIRVLNRTPVALAIVLMVTLLPRVVALDRFVTPDEYLWVTRSANFYCAVSQGDWRNTFQRQHPGVTTTWAGLLAFLAVGPNYADGCRQIDPAEHEQVLRAQGIDPLKLLQAGRLAMVLFNTGALALAFLYARTLIGPLPALIGFTLIALDPFHLALSRLLHLDGLLSSLMLLAMLACGSYLRRRRALDLVVSGIATGLSGLTKSPGILLIPFVAVAGILSYWRTRRATPVAALALWGIVAAATFAVLWPAMWVEPVNTVRRVADLADEYMGTGHSSPVFFAGTLYEDGKIGPEVFYFYPLTYLWRSTPVAVLGMLAAAFALAFKRNLIPEQSTRWLIIGLLSFSLLFTLVLTLSAKKFDRYLLPVFAPLDLVAGVGIVVVARWLWGRQARALWRYAGALVPCLAVAIQMTGSLRTAPYYLTYYNPLMGGASHASTTMMVGWGEGLDQAARYLNQKADASRLRIVSWYAPGCLSYFFAGSSSTMPFLGFTDADLQETVNDDYVVIYFTQQMQRQAPKRLLALLEQYPVEYSVWLNGIEYVRVYAMGGDIRTNATYQRSDAVLEDQIRLEGYSLSPERPTAGQALVVSLAWQVLQSPGERLKVFVHLLDSSGRLVAQNDSEPLAWRSPTDGWKPGQRYTDRHGIMLPSDLPAGEYRLEVGMYRASGERLQIATGRQIQDAIELGTVTIWADSQLALSLLSAYSQQFLQTFSA